ncbi:MAG TPA: methyl-accepting chemotaxis protein, partial [Thermoleophilia bacterium]|nr:methyl-accepting chemotaxis protein [Thermoleophilia bacterium]
LVSQQAVLRTLLAVGPSASGSETDARTGLSTVAADAVRLKQAVDAAAAGGTTFKTYPEFTRSWSLYHKAAGDAVAAAAAGRHGAGAAGLVNGVRLAAGATGNAAAMVDGEAAAAYDGNDKALWRFVYETLGVALAIIVLGALAGFGLAVWLPRSVATQLRRVIGALGSATSEMLAVVSRVAGTSVETATAISEAATTVDEVRQTSLLSSQKATDVSDDAQRAGEVAEAGRLAVAETVGDMEHIQQQMSVVADSVARLSEQSESVGAIMTTVNQLAEQSSLLAVNAAIEAASAGEHGKGFGVVADEIRNLASSSKKSVAQVRQILNDIQQATGAAVMATEQGARAIERGVERARETSDAIDALTGNVETAARSAMQIAASSQQQLVGMDQIAEAMGSIDEAGTHNAAGARQLEAGVAQIEEMAAEMGIMVSSINPLAALLPGRGDGTHRTKGAAAVAREPRAGDHHRGAVDEDGGDSGGAPEPQAQAPAAGVPQPTL